MPAELAERESGWSWKTREEIKKVVYAFRVKSVVRSHQRVVCNCCSFCTRVQSVFWGACPVTRLFYIVRLKRPCSLSTRIVNCIFASRSLMMMRQVVFDL